MKMATNVYFEITVKVNERSRGRVPGREEELKLNELIDRWCKAKKRSLESSRCSIHGDKDNVHRSYEQMFKLQGLLHKKTSEEHNLDVVLPLYRGLRAQFEEENVRLRTYEKTEYSDIE